MLPENVLPFRTLNKQQKDFVKLRLLEITHILRKWKRKISLDLKKKIKLSDVRSMILDETFKDKYPSISIDKQKLCSFANEYVEIIDGSVEYVLLCSFSAACIRISKKRARMVSAELNLDFNSVLEDLLQEAYASVHHSIYYFSPNKGSNEVSTYVISSLKRRIERFIRYNFSKLSPMSAEDCLDAYKLRSIVSDNHVSSVEELSKIASMDEFRVQEVLSTMTNVVREKTPKKGESSQDYKDYSIVSQVPDRSSSLDDLENVETVDLLKKLFDDIDEGMLSLSKEEKDVFQAAVSNNFERGWQSSFAKIYINQNTGKPYSRARIGQIYNGAIVKIKSHVSKAA